MNLTKVTEGPFLVDYSGGNPTSMAGLSKPYGTMLPGYIMGGLAEAISGADTSIDSSGVVCYLLAFSVVGCGNSAVTINGGNLRSNQQRRNGC